MKKTIILTNGGRETVLFSHYKGAEETFVWHYNRGDKTHCVETFSSGAIPREFANIVYKSFIDKGFYVEEEKEEDH